jgi:hypothetical protein
VQTTLKLDTLFLVPRETEGAIMEFLKLGHGTFLRANLIAGVAVPQEGGSASVSLVGGGEPIRIGSEEARELLRWLESSSSEVAPEGSETHGVYA